MRDQKLITQLDMIERGERDLGIEPSYSSNVNQVIKNQPLMKSI